MVKKEKSMKPATQLTPLSNLDPWTTTDIPNDPQTIASVQLAVDAMRKFEKSKSINPLGLTLCIYSIRINKDGKLGIAFSFSRQDSMLLRMLLIPAYVLGSFFNAFDLIDWAERVCHYRRLTTSSQTKMCNLIDAHASSMTRRLSALLESGHWNTLNNAENG